LVELVTADDGAQSDVYMKAVLGDEIGVMACPAGIHRRHRLTGVQYVLPGSIKEWEAGV
jgi:hypothetical protein